MEAVGFIMLVIMILGLVDTYLQLSITTYNSLIDKVNSTSRYSYNKSRR